MTTNIDLAQVHATLVSNIETLIASNDWEKHLQTQAAFHNYSFGNVLWLTVQAADRGIQPCRFAGFNTWKKMGRQVMKGEKGFKVLAPVMVRRSAEKEGEEKPGFVLRGFKVVTTFEKGQTEGKDLPEICQKLQGTSDEIWSTFFKLQGFVENRGWSLDENALNGPNGVCHLDAKLIELECSLSPLQKLKTLCHEVAHSMMHADDFGSHGKEEREVEAESVAYVVLSALGFDSSGYSFGYVASWSKGDVELVKKTGERVQRTAKAILTARQEGRG